MLAISIIQKQMEARIQGEIHGSDDFQSALNAPLSSYDALLIEGREVDGLENLSTGYSLFLMGYIPVMQMISGEDLEVVAREAGINYHDNIDADTHTIYYKMNSPLVRWLTFLLLLAALWSVFLLVPIIVQGLELPRFTWIFGNFIVSLMTVFGFPVAFMSFLATTSPGCLYGGLRDDYMAEQVDIVAEENGYERVLIQCGQSHVSGIERKLESKGWNVDSQRSQNHLGQALQLAGVPFAALCRAIGIVVLRLPGGKPPYLNEDN